MVETENVVTFRCSDELLEAIDETVDESQFDNRAQFLRSHLENTIDSNRIASSSNRSASESVRIESLEQRVADLEQRLPELEPVEQWPESEPAATSESMEEQRRDPQGERPEITTPEKESQPTRLEDRIEDIDVPGQGEKAERRREAVRAALEYIRENRKATPSDLRENVYPDHTADYTTGKDPARSWWKNCVYPALRELAEGDDRLEKGDTRGVWSYKPESGNVYDPTTEFSH